MIGWTNEQIDSFLVNIDFCKEGYDLMSKLGNYGLSLDEASDKLWANGYKEQAAWVRALKHTETFVRYNGTDISVTEYRMLNHMTNSNVTFVDTAEFKKVMGDILRQLIVKHNFHVNEEHVDEHGNATWICSEDFLSTLLIE